MKKEIIEIFPDRKQRSMLEFMSTVCKQIYNLALLEKTSRNVSYNNQLINIHNYDAGNNGVHINTKKNVLKYLDDVYRISKGVNNNFLLEDDFIKLIFTKDFIIKKQLISIPHYFKPKQDWSDQKYELNYKKYNKKLMRKISFMKIVTINSFSQIKSEVQNNLSIIKKDNQYFAIRYY